MINVSTFLDKCLQVSNKGCIFAPEININNNSALDITVKSGTMKIQEVINEIRNNEVGVMSIVLADASRYAKNSEGPMTWAGTLFTKKYANRRNGDEVIATGNKETNLTEVERTLTALIGKGEVQVRLMNGNWMTGDVEA